jgi:hypothetical protein
MVDCMDGSGDQRKEEQKRRAPSRHGREVGIPTWSSAGYTEADKLQKAENKAKYGLFDFGDFRRERQYYIHMEKGQ